MQKECEDHSPADPRSPDGMRYCDPSGECRALIGLIHWESSLDGPIGAANHCDADDRPSVRLDRDAVRDILQRCVSGQLNVLELPRWAEAVHMLDCVEIDEVDRDVLTQCLFEVSTPELFEPITVDVCRRWIRRMEEA
ncbi:hypothetical protein [Streptomyces xinghaiensis]|uniref:hypothetical protein n=1 Tax=Streptomyces xinghaiensis TaxID=1038928 RepID=UPI0005949E9F|nr:hypothetical protein [Streptomyces xinghaiensis]MZE77073.1 hypothetical protein [Streptomyces sp. SID5475]